MKKVLQQLGKYKRDTFLCIGLTALEVIMEILMPFVTAIIIDRGLEVSNLSVVYRYGALMVAMAFLSLIFGALAGKNAGSRHPYDYGYHQRAERLYDDHPCGGPRSAEPGLQLRHVPNHQPAVKSYVPDRRSLPGSGHRIHYGGYS